MIIACPKPQEGFLSTSIILLKSISKPVAVAYTRTWEVEAKED